MYKLRSLDKPSTFASLDSACISLDPVNSSFGWPPQAMAGRGWKLGKVWSLSRWQAETPARWSMSTGPYRSSPCSAANLPLPPPAPPAAPGGRQSASESYGSTWIFELQRGWRNRPSLNIDWLAGHFQIFPQPPKNSWRWSCMTPDHRV